MRVLATCLALILGLTEVASGQTSPDRELATLSIRPRVGGVPAGGSVGGAVLARISRYVGVTAAGAWWSYASSCPDVFPSTCGDDGRSLTGGVRLEATRTHSWSPFVEGQVGRYRFSERARDGDATLSLGVRAGIVWFTDSRVELEAAIEFQRLSGYQKDGVPFPVKEIGALQFGVGIPIR